MSQQDKISSIIIDINEEIEYASEREVYIENIPIDHGNTEQDSKNRTDGHLRIFLDTHAGVIGLVHARGRHELPFLCGAYLSLCPLP